MEKQSMVEKILGWKIEPRAGCENAQWEVYRAIDVLIPEIEWEKKAEFAEVVDAFEYLTKKIREEKEAGIIPRLT